MSTLDDLWDFDDLPASEERFRRAADQASHAVTGFSVAEALTQLARSEGLQRRYDAARATLETASAVLGDDDVRGRVRLLLEQGRVDNSSRTEGRGRDSFLAAWDVARDAGEDALAVDAAHMLGIVEEREGAWEWNVRALELARSSTGPDARRWIATLANNMGWARHDAGAYDEALELFRLALAERELQGDLRRTQIARWCVARCLRSLDRTDEALAEQQSLAAELDATGSIDGYVTEERAECLLALGRETEARPLFARAHAELSADPWVLETEPDRLARLARLGGH